MKQTAFFSLILVVLILVGCEVKDYTDGDSDYEVESEKAEYLEYKEWESNEVEVDTEKQLPQPTIDDCAGACDMIALPSFCLGDSVCKCISDIWRVHKCKTVCERIGHMSKGCQPSYLHEDKDYDDCFCEFKEQDQ